MQNDTLRHHLIKHANRLDTFSKVREEVQDIARNREAAGVWRSRRQEAGRERNKEKQCFFYQKKGHVKSDCRNRQRDMKKVKVSGQQFVHRKQTAAITDEEITGAVNIARSSLDFVRVSRLSHSCGSLYQRFKKTMCLGSSLTLDQQ